MITRGVQCELFRLRPVHVLRLGYGIIPLKTCNPSRVGCEAGDAKVFSRIMQIDVLFSILILLLSVVIHEVSHGYAALALGDSTAKYQGRLTLNPLKHIDLFGSIILPLLLVITKAGFVFGWAKPVPFNPYNLRNQRYGEALVAIAGPVSNIVVALFFGLLLRFGIPFGWYPVSFVEIASGVVFINLVLAGFNLVPLPPLDGSKVLFALAPQHLVLRYRKGFEQYGMIFSIIFIVYGWEYFLPLVVRSFAIITGLPI